MNMTIRPLRAEEQKYTYAQSQQIKMQTGMIGYLRGDFDSTGTGFYTSWFDAVESRKTDEFKAEFDEVINALRFDEQYGGLLAGRSVMQKYGQRFPDSIIVPWNQCPILRTVNPRPFISEPFLFSPSTISLL